MTSIVKTTRKKLKLTQKQLAEKSGVSLNTIKRLEQGKIYPKADNIRKLCYALGIHTITLFNEQLKWLGKKDA